MTKTPDQEAHTTATSTAGPIPRQAPIPTHKAGHTVNTGEQDTLDQQTGDEDVGNITLGLASGDPSAEPPARPREEPPKVTVKRRLEQEGRWDSEMIMLRDQMMRECRKVKGMTKADAQLWVYSELDRLYPPITKPTPDTPASTETTEHGSAQNGSLSHSLPMYSESEGCAIKGLSAIPEQASRRRSTGRLARRSPAPR